jgi:hypothetical protein
MVFYMENKLSELLLKQIKLRDNVIKQQEIKIIKYTDEIKRYRITKILLLSLLSISVIANILLLLR